MYCVTDCNQKINRKEYIETNPTDLLTEEIQTAASPLKMRLTPSRVLAGVVRKVNNAMHRINHYLADSAVCFVNTCPLDKYYLSDG